MTKNIIFISEIQNPYISGSSTQIMSKNLLEGMTSNNHNVHFIALVDWDNDEEEILKYYKNYCNEITIIKSKLQLRKYKSKYIVQMKLLEHTLMKKEYIQINNFEGDYDLIISHSPSIESIKLAEKLKQKLKIPYFQYWSDPMAISGILPENLNFKRSHLFYIEKEMHKKADRVIFGTKTLYNFQKKIFNNNENFRYVDVSYNVEENVYSSKEINQSPLVFGYSGQYISSIRNITPLYRAFLEDISESVLKIVGESDLKLDETNRIRLDNKRYSQLEIKNIEKEFDVHVMLLNENCIQIPGKIFYNANAKIPLIVILDGPYKYDIKAYLESVGTFIYCENDSKDIARVIKKIEENYEHYCKCADEILSPSRVVNTLLSGGIN